MSLPVLPVTGFSIGTEIMGRRFVPMPRAMTEKMAAAFVNALAEDSTAWKSASKGERREALRRFRRAYRQMYKQVKETPNEI